MFLAFLCQSFRILFVAVHLFFLRGSFVSSVATTLSTQTLFQGRFASFHWVSTVAYCLARLLSHQATGLSQFLSNFSRCAACSILPQAAQSNHLSPTFFCCLQECSFVPFRAYNPQISHTCFFAFCFDFQKLRQPLVLSA